MKKLILIAAVALMALPAAAQVQEAFPSYIQVNGRAEKEIMPDEFYLSVIINERDSKGKISVESQQRDMIAALKRLGVNVEKQLKVANLFCCALCIHFCMYGDVVLITTGLCMYDK